MKYYCYFWVGAASCYLDTTGKLQKRVYRSVGPTLAASLESLGYLRNDLLYRYFFGRFSLFYRYYFGRCSSKLAELVPLPYSGGRSTRYSRCYKDLYVNNGFFPCTARLWTW